VTSRLCLSKRGMNAQEHEEIIQQILNSKDADAEAILSQIGLDGSPSRAQVYSQIEKTLLLPPERLPDHWLSTYQMYESKL
jgi:antiviral helicase SKI2